MEYAFIYYLMAILPNVKEVLLWLGFVLLCISAMLVMLTGIHNTENDHLPRKTYGKSVGLFITAVFIGIFTAFIPSKQDMAIMAGAYATQKTVESDNTKAIAGKLNTIIHQTLDEKIKKKE